MMQTPVDTDPPSGLVNLGVVFHMPWMPKDDGHSANTSDMEGGMFQLTFIVDHKINNFSDVASLIKGSIHIIDRDGSGEFLNA